MTEPRIKEFKLDQEIENNIGKELPDIQTERRNESDQHFYDIEDSSDEDSDQEKEDGRCSIIYDHKEEHMPKEELAKVTARHMPSLAPEWYNEKYIFHTLVP